LLVDLDAKEFAQGTEALLGGFEETMPFDALGSAVPSWELGARSTKTGTFSFGVLAMMPNIALIFF